MDEKALSEAVFKFSAKFLNELDNTKSVVSSPLSAEFLLGIVTLGASEPAHRELLDALGFPDDYAIRSSFSTLLSKLKSTTGVTLNIANKIYVKNNQKLDSQMKNDAVSIFDTDIEGIDFEDSYGSAKRINEWVEKKTNNKLTNICSEGDITDDLDLILLNAVYFKGNWRKRFKTSDTKEGAFRVDATKTILVPMMNYDNDDSFKYGNSKKLDAEILVLPYEGSTEMMIVLPKNVDGLDEMLLKLAEGYDLMAALDNLHSQSVAITIPKFKIETEIDLSIVLKKLEIKSIFDFTLDKILKSKKPLRVSKAVQKAVIDFNEEGTEAAAVTICEFVEVCAKISSHFNANHPFLYALVGPGRIALFVGIYRGDDCAPTTDMKITNRKNWPTYIYSLNCD